MSGDLKELDFYERIREKILNLSPEEVADYFMSNSLTFSAELGWGGDMISVESIEFTMVFEDDTHVWVKFNDNAVIDIEVGIADYCCKEQIMLPVERYFKIYRELEKRVLRALRKVMCCYLIFRVVHMTDLILHSVYVHDRFMQLWNMPRHIRLIIRNVGKIAKETKGKCYVDYHGDEVEVRCSDDVKAGKNVLSIIYELGITPKLTAITTGNEYEVDGEPIEDYLMNLLEKARKEEEERKKRGELRERIAKELGIKDYEVELDESLDYMKSLAKTFRSVLKRKENELNRERSRLEQRISSLERKVEELGRERREIKEKYERLVEFIKEKGYDEEFVEWLVTQEEEGRKEEIREEYDLS